jgi:hypothetical protein
LPLLAIVTATFIVRVYAANGALRKLFSYLQYFLLIILAIFPFVILWFVFPSSSVFVWILAILPLVATLFFLYRQNKDTYRVISASLVMITCVNMFLSLWFYPQLLKYQSGNVVGRKVDALNIPEDAFFIYNYPGSKRNIHFYSKRIVTFTADPFSYNKDIYVLTDEQGLSNIKNQKKSYDIILQGEDYPVSQLTAEFLNAKTRASVTRGYYLVRIRKPPPSPHQ